MDCLTTRVSSCGCLTAHTSGHVCSHVHRVLLSELLSVFGYVWEWPGVCVQGCLQRFTMRARVCEQRQYYGIYL